jgi:hypothetical protein
MSESNLAEVEITEGKETETKPVLIIEGVRENGTKFRPSDWPERISSTFAVFGKDHRLHYAPQVCPRMLNGQKVLAIEPSLQWQNPTVFQAVMKFARENNLRTRMEQDGIE